MTGATAAQTNAATEAADSPDGAVLTAWRETESILAQDPRRTIADPTLPIYQHTARKEIEAEEARFAAGDRTALMAAIRICANHELMMPEWVARGFIRSYDAVLNCRVSSWDEAFGRPIPKGAHLNARKKRRLYAPLVRMEVARLHKGGTPIDEAMFEAVGKKFGLGKTLASSYYYGSRRLPQKT